MDKVNALQDTYFIKSSYKTLEIYDKIFYVKEKYLFHFFINCKGNLYEIPCFYMYHNVSN